MAVVLKFNNNSDGCQNGSLAVAPEGPQQVSLFFQRIGRIHNDFFSVLIFVDPPVVGFIRLKIIDILNTHIKTE